MKVVLLTVVLALAMGCAAPEPFIARQLDIKIDPKDAATYLLNPSPLGKGGYSKGMMVTIDILPQPGWQVEEWIGPVFKVEGTTAQIEMDSSQAVAVRLTSTSPGTISSPPVVAKSLPDATPTASSYYDKGRDWYNTGYSGKAVYEFNKLINLDPDYPGAYWWRGNANHQGGAYRDAIQDYEKAIQLDPSHSLVYVKRSKMEYGGTFSQKTPLKAIEAYDHSIRLDPRNATAYYNRGQAYLSLGKYAEAKADIAKACSLYVLYC